MSSKIVTANELRLVYVGEFANDPAADTAIDLATNFNLNMQMLDTVVTRVGVVEPLAQVTVSSGLSAKFINGGSF